MKWSCFTNSRGSERGTHLLIVVTVTVAFGALLVVIGNTNSVGATTPREIQESYGMDACTSLSASELTYLWKNTASYQGNLPRTFGVYIGGPDMASCGTASPSWISSVEAQEPWGFAPIWVGRQEPGLGQRTNCQVAPYISYSSYVSTTASTAFSEGETDGGTAVTNATSAGFAKPNIIYLDFEGYDSLLSTCVAAANAYISGWVYTVEYEDGWLAGVYGSLDSTIDDLAAAAGNSGQYVPYAIWPAACGTGTQDSAQCDTDAWNLPGLPNSDWGGDQRLYQWDENRDAFVGDRTVTVDVDCIDSYADDGLSESVWDPGESNETNELNSDSDDTLC